MFLILLTGNFLRNLVVTLFPVFQVCLSTLRISIPEARTSHNLPFWNVDSTTGRKSGYFIDFIEALFKEIDENYQFVTDPSYNTYGGLGEYDMQKETGS